MLKKLAQIGAALAFLATPAAAEIELSIYGGSQSLPHSRITGNVAGIGPVSKLIGWTGKSFAMPPYYGTRATWWRSDTFGWGLEFTHAKAYAPAAEMAPQFSRLEFTDGHNIFTLNANRRWPGRWAKGKLTPYVMGGVGIALPHVDIQPTVVGAPRTYGYQLTGPALKVGAGVKYDINHRWALFGEYQFTWSDNKVDVDGGGSLSTVLIANAINFGISLKF